MSLDVYLSVSSGDHGDIAAVERIFVREAGQTREISREEWERRFPGAEPVTVTNPDARGEVYSANITHNLGKMAVEAGIYKHLWRPEEIGIAKAAQLIPALAHGLALLKSDPERFKAFNPSNGWGDYGGFVEWVEKYLAACKENPDADVSVSR